MSNSNPSSSPDKQKQQQQQQGGTEDSRRQSGGNVPNTGRDNSGESRKDDERSSDRI